MKKIINVLICSLTLSGCVGLDKNIVVNTKPIEKPKLDISTPLPVKMQPIQWIVITHNNFNEIVDSVKDPNGMVFLVALDEANYKKLALNNANLLRYIREEKAVLAAYKKYYNN